LEAIQSKVFDSERVLHELTESKKHEEQEIASKSSMINEAKQFLENEKKLLLRLKEQSRNLSKTKDQLISKTELFPNILLELSDKYSQLTTSKMNHFEDKLTKYLSNKFWLEETEGYIKETNLRQSFRLKVRQQKEKNINDEEIELQRAIQEEESNIKFFESCSITMKTKIDEAKRKRIAPGRISDDDDDRIDGESEDIVNTEIIDDSLENVKISTPNNVHSQAMQRSSKPGQHQYQQHQQHQQKLQPLLDQTIQQQQQQQQTLPWYQVHRKRLKTNQQELEQAHQQQQQQPQQQQQRDLREKMEQGIKILNGILSFEDINQGIYENLP